MSQLPIIAGRYQPGDMIGQGGMGEVFAGEDTETGEPVAIKVLRSNVVSIDKGFITRFKREGEILRRLNHPNIVKVLATASDDNAHYIVMEYVTGGTLLEMIRKIGRLSISQTLSIGLELADALSRAHHLNIIHRDIKPSNVLIAADGTPRLTDFGVAHTTDHDLTLSGTVVGTLDYLSPEALNEREIDARSDLWAFGIMLFEMLTGKRPFSSDQLGAVVTNILTQPVPDLEQLRPDAPVDLVDLIYRMLQKDRQQRVPSVRVVGAELETLLHDTTKTTVMTPVVTSKVTSDDTPTRIFVRELSVTTPVGNAPPNNLPVESTPFVGREAEVMELVRLLGHAGTRLVTIIAPGGMGKTRLALKMARTVMHDYPDGVYFIRLAPLDSSDDMTAEIAEAVEFQFFPGGTPDEQLMGYFSEKRLLLILDNFEHLLDGLPLVSEILKHAPGVNVLATSRERLRLEEEHLFRIEGMDFPDWQTPKEALEYSAAKLFVQSARRVRPDFELRADDLHFVARICRAVGGMPLAIVLAAAWVEVLALEEIADEIGDNPDILETDLHNMPERHRSVRAVFDYSWDLLDTEQREVFHRLSVFRGGFTRSAAASVTGSNLRTLMVLVDKSLLRRDVTSGRYHIHELLRQYAEEKLTESGQANATRSAQSTYYLTELENRNADIKGRRQTQTLDDIEDEIQNIRVSWQWAVKHRMDDIVSHAVDTLKLFCEMRSRFKERHEFFGRAADILTGDDAQALRCLLAVRHTGFLQHDERAAERFEQCLQQAQDCDDPFETAYCLLALGDDANSQRDYQQAADYYMQSLEHFRALNESYYVAQVLNRLGLCYGNLGQLDQYLNYARESHDLARQIGDRIGTGWSLHGIATAQHLSGDYAGAEKCFHDAIEIWRELGQREGMASSGAALSWLAFLQGNFEQSQIRAEDALAVATEINHAIDRGFALSMLGALAAAEEDYGRAHDIFTEAHELLATHPLLVYWCKWGLAMTACGLADFPTVLKEVVVTLKFAAQIGHPASIVRAFPLIAVVDAHNGTFRRAIELIALAFHYDFASPKAWMEGWPLMNRLRVELEEKLGTEVYNEAWEHGKTLELQHVVDELLLAFGELA